MLIEKSYLIWRETIILKPMYTERGELWTIVHELYRKLIVQQSPFKIMNDSCDSTGASYQGIIDAAKLILPGRKMLPVCLSAGYRICILPTLSPVHEDCMWISYFHVKRAFEKNLKTFIECRNRELIEINGSVESFLTKSGHAQQLVLSYLDRQEEMWELSTYVAESYEGFKAY
jgi:competence transcription factor ComK